MSTFSTTHLLDPAASVLAFTLSDAEILSANLLAPNTISLLQTRRAHLTATMVGFEFVGKNEHEVLQLVREFIYLQGRHAAVSELLEQCTEAYQAAAEKQSQASK